VRSFRRTVVASSARCATTFRPARLSVLIFHRVLRTPDPLLPYEPDAAQFTQIMDWIASNFTPLSLSEGVDRLENGTLPYGAVCLTFDDGYEDNLSIAAPICAQRGIPFTVFVASGYLDGGIMWNDRVIESVRRAEGESLDLSDLGYGRHRLGEPQSRARLIEALLKRWKYLPFGEREALAREIQARFAPDLPSPMLSRAQVHKLRALGAEIGGHTVSHPILSVTEASDAMREIADNKADLEALLGQRLRFFAYPNGSPDTDFSGTHVALAKRAGYDAAFTTQPGVSTQATDRYRMPRFTPWDRSPLRFSARLVLNMSHPR
jgi:peptidoglycan/xylan/chitin deacetylase (PgdA/CDA1 family)